MGGEVGTHENSKANFLYRRLFIATTIAIHSSLENLLNQRRVKQGEAHSGWNNKYNLD